MEFINQSLQKPFLQKSLLQKPFLQLSITNINKSYNENIYEINFLNCPTPSRLMGKDKEIIKKWRIHMNNQQKNGLLKNGDIYKDIVEITL